MISSEKLYSLSDKIRLLPGRAAYSYKSILKSMN